MMDNGAIQKGIRGVGQRSNGLDQNNSFPVSFRYRSLSRTHKDPTLPLPTMRFIFFLASLVTLAVSLVAAVPMARQAPSGFPSSLPSSAPSSIASAR